MNIYFYPSKQAKDKLETIIHRDPGFHHDQYDQVVKILDDVRKNGDEALVRYTRQFDCPDFTINQLKLSLEEIEAAVADIDKSAITSLDVAASQIEAFHRNQTSRSWFSTHQNGTILGQMVHPVDVAGIYVPGGKGGTTPLVSTVLMCAIPAKIAGVPRIIMVTPPMKNGKINPYLMVAAAKAGVNEIYRVGSAWAIGAMAYGTQTIPKVNVIVGPGNIYVTLAKKIVSGTVGIDMIAGPSEILVLADDSAVPEFIAADLLSQAEHDPLSSAILITPSEPLATSVLSELNTQLQSLDRSDIAKKSLENFGAIFLTSDIDTAIDLANQIAPEHLELQISEPFNYIGQIRHAGAVFIGNYTPEPIGDYIAGPNHVLPTSGTAKFSSALSVDHFIKKTSMIYYSKSAFIKQAQDVIQLATLEGLSAHANSVHIRMKHIK